MTLKKNKPRPNDPWPRGGGKQDGGVARRHITALRRLLIAAVAAVLAVWGLVGTLLAAPVMSAPDQSPALLDSRNRVNVSAVLQRSTASPSADLLVAVIFKMAPNWHINTNDPRVPPELGDASSYIKAQIKVDPVPGGALQPHEQFIQWPQPQRTDVAFAGKVVSYEVFGGRAVAYLPVSVAEDAPLGHATLTLRVTYQACDDTMCLAPVFDQPIQVVVDIEDLGVTPSAQDDDAGLFAGFDVGVWQKIHDGSATPSAVTFNTFGLEFAVDTGSALGMALLLAVAALGGFLLNLTPCVLPIIPIKVMGLSQAAGHPRRCFVLGVFVSLGVVAFWTTLAAVMATITSFTAVNQMFQSPLFPIGVGVFIAVMAIGMCGLFSIRLPQFVYHITPRQDTYAGSFLFGIMAAVLSTPCTAPFMGAALGWSARQSPAISLATFTAVGAGMALPYLVLAAWPRLVAKVPRTGPASVLVKQVMGLFMLAGAAYFIGVGVTALTASPHGPAGRFYWWPVMLLVAAGGVWMAWRTVRFSRSAMARTIFVGLGGVIVFGSVALGVRLTAQGPVNWVHYTPERFEEAIKEGKVVVLDFTAEWCLNCKALEESVLRNPAIVGRLKKDSVVPMKVDLTTGRNEAGRRMLARMERLTIPLLVIFGHDGGTLFKSDFYTAKQVTRVLDKAVAAKAPRRPAN